ncbi:hypothetical protein FACS1894201_02050 [Bacteroidia bacterium]|nr:hypothetical protein FACS1894201_02050 [Bacteroidia bacterium]
MAQNVKFCKKICIFAIGRVVMLSWDVFLNRLKKNIMKKLVQQKIKCRNRLLVVTLMMFCALQIHAQSFHIGSPAKTSVAKSAIDNQKEVFGDEFVRGGKVVLNRKNLNDQAFQKALLTSNALSIQLFSDLAVTANKTKVRTTAKGGIYWTGDVVGSEHGSLTLFLLNGYMVGTLRIGDHVVDISPDANGDVNVVELNLINDAEHEEACFRTGAETVDVATDDTESTSVPAKYSSILDTNGNYVIDVMILYPTEIANVMGGTLEARTAAIEYRIADANEIFENSEIGITFNLLHHEINNVIDKNVTSVADVRGATGIRDLRDMYGADIVSHWNYLGSAGVGYLWSSASNVASTGFNTAKYSDVTSRYTFVHECGHNLGANHDRYEFREAANIARLSTSPYYHFGKVWTGYRSIMAYANCTTVGGTSNSESRCGRIKHFTNPDVMYNGVPTGVEGDTPSTVLDGGPANNARRLNAVAQSVSACRDAILPDNDATLSLLTLSTGKLSPTFNSAVYEYTATIPNTSSTLTVNTVKNNLRATVVGDGQRTLTGRFDTLDIVVTSSDNTTQLTYRIIVCSQHTDVTLSNLQVSLGTMIPEFSPNVLDYKVYVNTTVTSITINATPNDTAQTIEGDGVQPVEMGKNTFNIKVSAEYVSLQRIYTVAVYRQENDPTVVRTPTLDVATVYPNPTTGIVYIETDDENPIITVYDMNGTRVETHDDATVSTTTKGSIALDLSHLPNGIYLLDVNGKQVKIVKQ